jgi:hypothetical protein
VESAGAEARDRFLWSAESDGAGLVAALASGGGDDGDGDGDGDGNGWPPLPASLRESGLRAVPRLLRFDWDDIPGPAAAAGDSSLDGPAAGGGAAAGRGVGAERARFAATRAPRLVARLLQALSSPATPAREAGLAAAALAALCPVAAAWASQVRRPREGWAGVRYGLRASGPRRPSLSPIRAAASPASPDPLRSGDRRGQPGAPPPASSPTGRPGPTPRSGGARSAASRGPSAPLADCAGPGPDPRRRCKASD